MYVSVCFFYDGLIQRKCASTNGVSVSAVCFLRVCGRCDPELSTIDHDLSFGRRLRGAAADRLCERVSEEDQKSIAFHYVVGWCHWPVNDPVTAAVHR